MKLPRRLFVAAGPDPALSIIVQNLILGWYDALRYASEPTAYGLERVICAQGGPCTKPLPMPKEQWDAAWAEAKHRVTVYLQVAKPR
jgi:hypothetical protein